MEHPIVHSQLDRLTVLLNIAKHAQAQVLANPHPNPELEMLEPEPPPPPPHEPYR